MSDPHCVTCTYSISQSQLQLHQSVAHSMCPSCKHVFNSDDELHLHQKQSGHCYCFLCCRAFASAAGIYTHMRTCVGSSWMASHILAHPRPQGDIMASSDKTRKLLHRWDSILNGDRDTPKTFLEKRHLTTVLREGKNKIRTCTRSDNGSEFNLVPENSDYWKVNLVDWKDWESENAVISTMEDSVSSGSRSRNTSSSETTSDSSSSISIVLENSPVDPIIIGTSFTSEIDPAHGSSDIGIGYRPHIICSESPQLKNSIPSEVHFVSGILPHRLKQESIGSALSSIAEEKCCGLEHGLVEQTQSDQSTGELAVRLQRCLSRAQVISDKIEARILSLNSDSAVTDGITAKDSGMVEFRKRCFIIGIRAR